MLKSLLILFGVSLSAVASAYDMYGSAGAPGGSVKMISGEYDAPFYSYYEDVNGGAQRSTEHDRENFYHDEMIAIKVACTHDQIRISLREAPHYNGLVDVAKTNHTLFIAIDGTPYQLTGASGFEPGFAVTFQYPMPPIVNAHTIYMNWYATGEQRQNKSVITTAVYQIPFGSFTKNQLNCED